MAQITMDTVSLLNYPLMESWDVPIFIAGSSQFDASYYPEFKDGKLQAIYIADSGVGNFLEASSHEFAHIIDLSIRGKLSRLRRKDYGMSFEKVANPNKAIQFEAKVMAIQAKLLKIAGFSWNEIDDVIDSYIVPSLDDLESFKEATVDLKSGDIIQAAKKLRMATLFKHWQNATNYLKALM